MMSHAQIAIIWVCLLVVMLACRCLPLMLLRDRTLPPRVERAIGLIPVAAFTALVANDLINPATMVAEPLVAVVTLASAAAVFVVARKTGSLIWCALVGMGAYALLSLVVL